MRDLTRAVRISIVTTDKMDGVFEPSQINKLHIEGEEHRASNQPEDHQRKIGTAQWDLEEHNLANPRGNRCRQIIDGGVDIGMGRSHCCGKPCRCQQQGCPRNFQGSAQAIEEACYWAC